MAINEVQSAFPVNETSYDYTSSNDVFFQDIPPIRSFRTEDGKPVVPNKESFSRNRRSFPGLMLQTTQNYLQKFYQKTYHNELHVYQPVIRQMIGDMSMVEPGDDMDEEDIFDQNIAKTDL